MITSACAVSHSSRSVWWQSVLKAAGTPWGETEGASWRLRSPRCSAMALLSQSDTESEWKDILTWALIYLQRYLRERQRARAVLHRALCMCPLTWRVRAPYLVTRPSPGPFKSSQLCVFQSSSLFTGYLCCIVGSKSLQLSFRQYLRQQHKAQRSKVKETS